MERPNLRKKPSLTPFSTSTSAPSNSSHEDAEELELFALQEQFFASKQPPSARAIRTASNPVSALSKSSVIEKDIVKLDDAAVNEFVAKQRENSPSFLEVKEKTVLEVVKPPKPRTTPFPEVYSVLEKEEGNKKKKGRSSNLNSKEIKSSQKQKKQKFNKQLPSQILSSEKPLIALVESGAPAIDSLSEEQLQMAEFLKDVETPGTPSTPAPPSTRTLQEIVESWRFDFQGNIILDLLSISPSGGLHHHGDSPSLAGYTIKQIIQLIRSTVPTQRIININILRKIIENAKNNKYNQYYASASTSLPSSKFNMLEHLIANHKIALLLRMNLDETNDTLVTDALFTLHALMIDKNGEELFDFIESSTHFDEFHTEGKLLFLPPSSSSLFIPPPQLHDETLQDIGKLSSSDLVLSLVKMQLIQRLRYLWELGVNESASPSNQYYQSVRYAIDILIRCARHSPSVSNQICKTPKVLKLSTSLMSLAVDSSDATSVQIELSEKAAKLLSILTLTNKQASDKIFGDDQLGLGLIGLFNLFINRYNLLHQPQPLVSVIKLIKVPLLHIYHSFSTISVNYVQKILGNLQSCFSGLCEALKWTIPYLTTTSDQRELYSKLTNEILILMELLIHILSKNPNIPTSLVQSFGILEILPHVRTLLDHQLRTFAESFPTILSQVQLTACAFSLLYAASKLEQLFANISSLVDELLGNTSVHLSLFTSIFKSASINSSIDQPFKIFHSLSTFASFADSGMKCLPHLPMTSITNVSHYKLEYCISTCVNAYLQLFQSSPSTIQRVAHGVLYKESPNDVIIWISELLTQLNDVNDCELATNRTFSHSNLVTILFLARPETMLRYQILRLIARVASLTTSSKLLKSQHVTDEITLSLWKTSNIHKYYDSAMKLISRFISGDEEYVKDIMANVVFNPLIFLSLGSPNNSQCLTELHGVGNSLYQFYEQYITYSSHQRFTQDEEQKGQRIKSMSIIKWSPDNSSCDLLPMKADWPFLPISFIYNASQSDSTNATVELMHQLLSFIFYLESVASEHVSLINAATKMHHIMKLFLINGELFLDTNINRLLHQLFKLYTSSFTPDFDQIVGSSFIGSFFEDFIYQFNATSFGDSTFGEFVILFLRMQYNSEYRKKIFNEMQQSITALIPATQSLVKRIQTSKELSPQILLNYLTPFEYNSEVLEMYINLLIGTQFDTDIATYKQQSNPRINRAHNEFLYWFMIHHLTAFLFPLHNSDISNDWIRQEILSKLIHGASQELVEDVIGYKCHYFGIAVCESTEIQNLMLQQLFKCDNQSVQQLIEHRSQVLQSQTEMEHR